MADETKEDKVPKTSVETLPPSSTPDFFDTLEKKILKVWKEADVYAKMMKRKDGPLHRFMDGPPFVSSPHLHYGHILVSMVKSSLMYYMYMKGHRVQNRLGYDCHGLPMEFQANKHFGFPTNKQIREEIGLASFNGYCQALVDEYSGQWTGLFDRIGRLADYADTYKTRDFKFMESVWWVFKQLYDKGLVYRGVRVLPYSTTAGTSLSSFEAGENYQMRTDPSLFVKFRLVPQSEKEAPCDLVAWTTTPWTLLANQALCVNPDATYLRLKDKASGERWVVAEDGLPNLYPSLVPSKKKKEGASPNSLFEVEATFPGRVLEGRTYHPIFPFVPFGSTNHRVFADAFVKVAPGETAGTGVVHIAPGFGDEDFWLCQAKGVISSRGEGLFCPVDENGVMTSEVGAFGGLAWKDANAKVVAECLAAGSAIRMEPCTHSYPHCGRFGTPLIYRAVDSFFVEVTKLRDRLVAINKEVEWVPDHVGKKRFHDWISNARDWNVSRNRFYGTPIPVWVSDEGEMVCVGSVKELAERSGMDLDHLTDLHPEHLEGIEWTDEKGATFRRVTDVFDCWFESGSVPFAQHHFPFDSPDLFDGHSTLSDFICEGLDQTRGWFYTLQVLATALMDCPAFKHVICTGLVTSEGKKLSKRLKNYVDPREALETYGADALRLYLISSPLVRAEPLEFQPERIKDFSAKLIPWYEGFRFFIDHARLYTARSGRLVDPDGWMTSANLFDKWILSRLGRVVAAVEAGMGTYHIYQVFPHLLAFIEDLTNWYIKFNRDRFKNKFDNHHDYYAAMSTLLMAMKTFCRVMAPFTPFLAETMFQEMGHVFGKEHSSVLLETYPSSKDFCLDEGVEDQMAFLRTSVNLIRKFRETHTDSTFASVKYPIYQAHFYSDDERLDGWVTGLAPYFHGETNVLTLETSAGLPHVTYSFVPNHKTIGQTFRRERGKVLEGLASIPSDRVRGWMEGEELFLEGFDTPLKVDPSLARAKASVDAPAEDGKVWLFEDGVLVCLDIRKTEETDILFERNWLVRFLQEARKSAGLNPWDVVEFACVAPDSAKHLLNLVEEKMKSRVFQADGPLADVRDIGKDSWDRQWYLL